MFKNIFSKSINIPTLRLSGVIGQTGAFRSGLTLNSLNKLIDRLFSDKKSPAVALIVNSPGGSPAQSSLIAEKIIDKSKEKNKKVIAFVEDVAASGGYWLACSADEIFIDQNSIIGSIGVISPGFGFVNLIKKIGIERRVYTSGKSKSFLDPFKPERKEDIDRLKKIQEQIHENFISFVKSRRGKKLNKNQEKEVFSGLFWVGKRALDFGLVDGIGSINTVLVNKFGKNVKIKYIDQKKSFIQRKLSSSLSASLVNADELIDKIEEKSLLSRYGL
ncbi:MAG: putative signal peptide peptidase SppA [Alphaproteobacteria bacterium MarineAlpha5_Bin8]|nr:MAG: putative signal peptide peptidase SppA [Alphaproteobacteria bacterium MarineAlpha5_Bin7]PPR45659.1 MAG: putative signal peptide peptidase SppA [Alphaproteobacteria bacterium MarineAlpha5_Bin8]PPR53961.1 MAG: putative signal peptide peptidase SppA [Alphaproteobacteria bacterium MarineAlpha5_Bin6]|tara:strand:- start:205 stop:1029 length:825 start_codon:yes stop_codon:yes gene_type:complete